MRSRIASGILTAAMALGSVAGAQSQPTDAGASIAEVPTVVDMDGGSAKSAEQFHAEGVKALHERRMPAAIAALQQAVALEPKSALFVTDLGYAYLLDDRLGDAETAFKQGIALEPTRPHAYGHLVECVLRESHRWEKRAEIFQTLEQGLRVSPERESRVKLGIARIRAERGFGLLERAREHVEEALRERHMTRPLEKQLLEMKARLIEDEKARSMRDWPEPAPTADTRERMQRCEQMSGAQSKKEGLECAAELLEHWPAWRAPRQLRVKILSEQGHYDEAVKELATLIRLQPSEPMHYRQLGLLLAEHGGLLELDRADEALRIAFALEPEWTELVEVRERLATRRFDSLPRQKKAFRANAEPTENARRLYDEAESALAEGNDRRESAQEFLEQALRESPAFVEAAALFYAITRRIPERTVEALWSDATGLFALYQECSHTEPVLPHTVLERWLNHAIELGSVEGRLTRALNQKNRGDKSGAERELANYLALVSNREEVQAVQLLRSELLDKPRSATGLAREAILNARLRLQSDDTEGALRLLEAPCRPALDSERLLWLGVVYEHRSELGKALECYDFGLASTNELPPTIARRLARLLARADAKWLNSPAARWLAELVGREPAAEWALARRALESGRTQEAQGHAERYLAVARTDDRFVPEARAMRQRMEATARLQAASKQQRLNWLARSGVGALVILLVGAYWIWFRGLTVARAVRKRPRLFPELQRSIGQIRHDVLKHRTSALQLLAQEPSMLPKLRRTLLEPVPTSKIVTEAYERLSALARSEGLNLRRLTREPVFGALTTDLHLVECSLDDLTHVALVHEIDVRLRGLHSERLQALLSNGPRCELDAATIQSWIAVLRAQMTSRKQPYVAPALQMSDLNCAFPIDSAALFQIFSNLLRNAQSAAQLTARAKVLVRLQHEQDFAGRTWVRLQIGDNAETPFNEADIEARAADRGLGIVRTTAREWNGRIVVLPEAEPYRKTVGVEFAL